MDSNELSDEFKEQARGRETEGELAEPAESGDTALTLDDLDGAAGGRIKRHRILMIGALDPMAGSDGNRDHGGKVSADAGKRER